MTFLSGEIAEINRLHQKRSVAKRGITLSVVSLGIVYSKKLRRDVNLHRQPSPQATFFFFFFFFFATDSPAWFVVHRSMLNILPSGWSEIEDKWIHLYLFSATCYRRDSEDGSSAILLATHINVFSERDIHGRLLCLPRTRITDQILADVRPNGESKAL